MISKNYFRVVYFECSVVRFHDRRPMEENSSFWYEVQYGNISYEGNARLLGQSFLVYKIGKADI